MEKYVVILVAIVGLAGLFCLVNTMNPTGMMTNKHVFFSESICGDPDLVPAIAMVNEYGKEHSFIYDCIPKTEKIYVPSNKFDLDERQKMKRLKDYVYIYKLPNR